MTKNLLGKVDKKIVLSSYLDNVAIEVSLASVSEANHAKNPPNFCACAIQFFAFSVHSCDLLDIQIFEIVCYVISFTHTVKSYWSSFKFNICNCSFTDSTQGSHSTLCIRFLVYRWHLVAPVRAWSILWFFFQFLLDRLRINFALPSNILCDTSKSADVNYNIPKTLWK